jgi:hypothetical protein
MSALSSIQDLVTEAIQMPWPAAAATASLSYVPLPGAAVRNGMLLMWFGDVDQPDLSLDPIQISTALSQE